MSGGVIRPLLDGGFSVCKANPENIGKRRCRHILSEVAFEVKKEGDSKFIDITGQMDGKSSEFSIKTTEKEIKEYIKNLSSGLDQKDKDSILDALRG